MKSSRLRLAWVLRACLLLSLVLPCAGATRYVSPGGSNEPPYLDWSRAATNIQVAINICSNGDQVIVDSGTYSGPIGFRGKNIEVVSRYALTTNESYIDSTVIDGSAAGHAVTFTNGETSAALLKGFTIRNGSATGPWPEGNGGGIRGQYSSPRLEDLVVTRNWANNEGGGVYFDTCNAALKNVKIVGNGSGNNGGGYRSSYGTVTVEGLVVGCNTSQAGTGMHIYHTTMTIKNALICDNVATGEGGAGMYFDGASPEIYNATIVGNRAIRDGEGGGLNVSFYSHPKFVNCILWSNQPQQVYFNQDWYSMAITLDHCDVQGGTNAIVTLGKGPVYWTDSFAADPRFVGGGDFRLQTSSPCINAGTNRSWMAASTDLDGNPRVIAGIVDLGGYESQGTGPVVTVTAPDAPSGPDSGYVGIELAFNVSGAEASDEGPVDYRLDWGDGNLSEWSSATTTVHTWSFAITSSVRAQARSVSSPASVSFWSPPHTVIVVQVSWPSAIHYVSPAGSNTVPYTNWSMAAHRIQDAINIAQDGARVIVGPATYFEAVNFKGKDIEVVSLYDSTGDPGYIDSTIIDASNAATAVTFTNGESSAALLKGFTIRNGRAAGPWPKGNGGGIRGQYSSPRLENLVLTRNWAQDEGGGICFDTCNAALRNVKLLGNASGNNGGGYRSSYGTVTVDGLVVGCNTSQAGTGMHIYHTTMTIKNALICDNVATGEGGAGMYFDGASPEIYNATIVGNRAIRDGEGGGLNVSYCSRPKFVNCILWSNQPQQVYFNQDWYSMAITLDHCDVQGGTNAIVTLGKGPVYWTDSFDADPVFVGAGDYSLASASPCRDVGTNRSWMAAGVDVAGNSRIYNGVVDLGAYEYAPAPEPLGSVRCTINPPDVCVLGAQWRVTSGPDTDWRDSGEVVDNLPPGPYTVTFKAVSGWAEPGDEAVAVGTNITASIAGTYQPLSQDTVPPVFISIFPWDGYVTQSNKLWMTVVVTDNVGVASVTVNGDAASNSAPDTYLFEVKPLNGHYHYQTVVAVDLLGNRATQVVCYAQSVKIRLTAIWNGYWRVRNPFDDDFPYLWWVKENPGEGGSGFCHAHSDDYFSTSLGAKHVILCDSNGVIVDEKGWSPKDPPAFGTPAALVDSDGDGLLNLDEDIAGSDPEDGSSTFALRLGEPDVGGGMRKTFTPGSGLAFAWEASSNALYTLEGSTNLVDWTVIPEYSGIRGNGDVLVYTNPVEGPIFFLRVWGSRAP